MYNLWTRQVMESINVVLDNTINPDVPANDDEENVSTTLVKVDVPNTCSNLPVI